MSRASSSAPTEAAARRVRVPQVLRVRPRDKADMEAWVGVLVKQLAVVATARAEHDSHHQVVHLGWLHKRGGGTSQTPTSLRYHRRYCVLVAFHDEEASAADGRGQRFAADDDDDDDDDDGSAARSAAPPPARGSAGGVVYELRYFKTELQAQQGQSAKRGVIQMGGVRDVSSGGADDELSISLDGHGRTWQLRAESAAEHSIWLAHLRKACPDCQFYAPPPKPLHGAYSMLRVLSSRGAAPQQRWATRRARSLFGYFHLRVPGFERRTTYRESYQPSQPPVRPLQLSRSEAAVGAVSASSKRLASLRSSGQNFYDWATGNTVSPPAGAPAAAPTAPPPDAGADGLRVAPPESSKGRAVRFAGEDAADGGGAAGKRAAAASRSSGEQARRDEASGASDAKHAPGVSFSEALMSSEL